MRPDRGGVIFTSFSGMASMLPGASVCVAISCSCTGAICRRWRSGDILSTVMLPSSCCVDWTVGVAAAVGLAQPARAEQARARAQLAPRALRVVVFIPCFLVIDGDGACVDAVPRRAVRGERGQRYDSAGKA